MSYTITLSNGSTLIPGGLADGTVDTAYTSLTLVGKNYAGYGQFLNENNIKLLENFANGTSPANPLKGQLWWDSTAKVLKVYSGTSWKITTGATSASASNPPSDVQAGDLWFDTSNTQLKVYSGTTWIIVGPATSPATGETGAFPVLMSDTSSGGHIVIQFKFSGVVYAIFSKDTFSSSLTGFASIKAGINFSTAASPAWVLNTQDVAATNNTLVQRDGSGGINAVAVNATSVQAAAVNATTINGNIVVPSGGSFTSSGYSTYNGNEILTLGGPATFSSINNTIIGNAIPSTATFLSVLVSGPSGLTVASGGIAPSSNLVANIGSSSAYFNQTYSNSISVLNSITPTSSNTASLGTNSVWFNNAYLSTTNANTVTVSSGVTSAANLVANIGNSGNWFNSIFAANINFLNNLIPSANVSSNIGSSLRYFNSTFTLNNYTGTTYATNFVANTGITPYSNATSTVGSASNYFNSGYFGNVTVLNSVTPTSNLAASLGSSVNYYTNTYSGTVNVITGVLPAANLSANIGSSTSWFNIIFGKSVQAQYADLAERFAADYEYDPGTVVEIGGPAEITAAGEELSENVFGVISTNAAYLMNAGAGSNATHPPIAVQGRVPVRVTGRVSKGDRLVSAGNGMARAGKRSEITAWNVIGRALENKQSDGVGMIEAIVKLNS